MGVWTGVALLTAVAQVAAAGSESTYVSRGAASIWFCGYEVTEHKLTADDDYITTTFRLPRTNNSVVDGQPVLLQHGLFSSCRTWFQIGGNSLPCMLARRGYDVWVTNARGNSYSMLHKTLDPNRDKDRYWDFSFHQMAVRDLPATIDYILKHTKKDKVSYIGHSLGGAMDFALLSEVPRYNDMINVAVSLAPAVSNEVMYEHFDTLFWKILKLLPGVLLKLLWLGLRLILGTIIEMEFSNDKITLGPTTRSEGIDDFKLQMLRTLDYILVETKQKRGSQRGSGWDYTSIKNLQHVAQTAYFGRFQKFSYGEDKNKKVYGSPEPPLYKLRNVKTLHFIMYADMDILTPAKVVERLCSDLPKNVRVCKRVEKSDFGHFDFTASHDAKQYVNDEILKVLRKHLPAPPTTPTPPTTTPVNPECIV